MRALDQALQGPQPVAGERRRVLRGLLHSGRRCFAAAAVHICRVCRRCCRVHHHRLAPCACQSVPQATLVDPGLAPLFVADQQGQLDAAIDFMLQSLPAWQRSGARRAQPEQSEHLWRRRDVHHIQQAHLRQQASAPQQRKQLRRVFLHIQILLHAHITAWHKHALHAAKRRGQACSAVCAGVGRSRRTARVLSAGAASHSHSSSGSAACPAQSLPLMACSRLPRSDFR